MSPRPGGQGAVALSMEREMESTVVKSSELKGVIGQKAGLSRASGHDPPLSGDRGRRRLNAN